MKFFTKLLIFSMFWGCSMTTTDKTLSKEKPGSMQINALNPFYEESSLYMYYPPFDDIKVEHYEPAFTKGMAEQESQINAIAENKEPPTFENTILEMEKSGAILDRVATVFFALTSAHTNEGIEKIRAAMAPKLSAHSDKILLNELLFKRISKLYEERNDLGIDQESVRLVEKYYVDFIRSGAKLSKSEKQKLKELNGEIAILQTNFSQNVLKEVNDLAIVVNDKEELEGLSPSAIQAAANEANSRGFDGKFVIALKNTSGQPAMSSLKNRALREKIHKTSLSRGSRGGEFDNREILSKVLKLRAEKALMLGYPNHAAYSLESQTAKTPKAVNLRLGSLAPKSLENAKKEAVDLQKMIQSEGESFKLASWDWDYYTEKVRSKRYNFDASQLKPYFEMNNVLEKGVFFAATELFGITFKERNDLPVYQEDVRVFEVFDVDGKTMALFLFDGYARTSKRGGAWMNAYVSQSRLMNRLPIVANHQNVVKPPEGCRLYTSPSPRD